MKLLKKIFVVTLCITLMLSLIPVSASGATLVESGGAWQDIKYELFSDGTLVLSGEGRTESVEKTGRYSQPWNSSDKYITKIIVKEGVTGLGENAFSDCTDVISISLPDSLISVGTDAFADTAYYKNPSNWENGALYIGNCLIKAKNIYGKFTVKEGTKVIADSAFGENNFIIPHNNQNPYLTSVDIPDSVVSIGAYAFGGCQRLSDVKLSDSLKYIEYGAFQGCAFSEISLPDGLVKIGNYAFEECASLNKIVLPDTVTEIGSNAFSSCTALTELNIPDSVREIGIGAFSGCTSLRSIEIPSGVKELNSSTFYNCLSLSEVILPDGLEIIDYSTFFGCSSLTEIALPDNLTLIEPDAFAGTGIFNDPFNREAGILYIDKYLIDADDGIYGRYTVKDGTRLIASAAFSNCKNLTRISIPDSVHYIGSYAFENCTGLTFAEFPENITEIPYAMFYGCSSLASFTFGEKIKNIGQFSFYGCSSLAEVIIPENVDVIEGSAFSGCENVYRIELPDKPLLISSSAFYDTGYYNNSANRSNKSLYIGKHLISVERYSGDYTVRPGTLSVASGTFMRCDIGTLTFPDGVILLGEDLFSSEGSFVKNVIIADSVEYIGQNAFFGQYNSIENIKLSSGVRVLDTLFVRTSFDHLIIPEGVTTIRGLFGESGAKKLTIPVSVTEITENAFSMAYIDEVYYEGDIAQWNSIDIGKGNGVLKYAKIHFAKSHTHKYSSVITKEAACTEDGIETFTCACKDSYEKPLKATGHVWGGWSVLPGSADTEVRECEICKNSETRALLESENGEIVIKDSEFIKVSEDVIYVLPEKNADEVYKNAVSGTVICDKNGNEIKSNASLCSGMKVYLKNGEGSIDEKILIIPCDADGDGAVSASDARIALRNSVGLDEFEPWQTAAADMVNPEDKEVASDDARYILRASVGLEDISEWIKA